MRDTHRIVPVGGAPLAPVQFEELAQFLERRLLAIISSPGNCAGLSRRWDGLPMATVFFVSCPHCDDTVDAYLGVHTGLGPPTLKCVRCRKKFATNRKEWPQMSPGRKAWFVFFSVVCIAAGAFMGGFMNAIAFRTGYTLKETVALDDSAFNRLFYPAVALWVALLTLFQGYRVHCSIRRFYQNSKRLPRAPWWSLQVGAQVKVVFVILGLSALAFLLGLLARAGR
jgi:hypothetical protein